MKSQDLWSLILETIDEGIHVVDQYGVTIFYNRVASQLDGMQPEQVLGKHLLDAFPSLAQETSTLLRVLTTGQPIHNQHQTYMNKEGKWVDTINTTLPVLRHGECIAAVEIAKDYSRLQTLANRLTEIQAQMKTGQIGGREERRLRFYHLDQIITQDEKMLALIEQARRAARTNSPILVYGETGTGKELFVQGIHQASPRSGQPFIAQNCAALPASLLEGLLFGTVRGSFTGAVDRPGLFELADGGTLFLDEINSMPLELQAKLLRVLQEKQVRRVGGTQSQAVDVRIMAATNQKPLDAVEQGALREDLFYRLQVVALPIPPLRERLQDIPLLTQYFITSFKQQFTSPLEGVSAEVAKVFQQYSWPGNVRELKHVIEAAFNLSDGPLLKVSDLPDYLLDRNRYGSWQQSLSLQEQLFYYETQLIEEALLTTGGNLKKAAQLLGIPRQTLQYKLAKRRTIARKEK